MCEFYVDFYFIMYYNFRGKVIYVYVLKIIKLIMV